MSPWINNWNEMVEMSQERRGSKQNEKGAVSPAFEWNFVQPLGWAQEAFHKVKAVQSSITGLHQITRELLAAVEEIKYNDDAMARSDRFTIGPYFDQFSPRMTKGVIPSKQFFYDDTMHFRDTVLLVAFVKDFSSLFESTNAMSVSSDNLTDLNNTARP